MIKIRLNKQAKDFMIEESTIEFDSSSDGYRRSRTYKVSVWVFFTFGNEREEADETWSYDLVVETQRSYEKSRHGFDNPETEFTFAYERLRSRGYVVIDHPRVYVEARTSYSVHGRFEGTINVSFADRLNIATDDDVIVSAEELVEMVQSGKYLAGHAISDISAIDKQKFKVDADSVGESLVSIRLSKDMTEKAIEEGRLSAQDITDAFKAYLERDGERYCLMYLEGLDQSIEMLSEAEREAVLGRSQMDEGSLDIFRKYAPQHIRWSGVKPENVLLEDLQYMSKAPSKLLEKILQDYPETESQIVDNVWELCSEPFQLVQALKSHTAQDIWKSCVRGISRAGKTIERWDKAGNRFVQTTGELTLTDVSREEFDLVVDIARLMADGRDDKEKMILLLAAGTAAGVTEEELAKALEDAIPEEERNSAFVDWIYEKYNFAPGRAWVEEKRQAIQRATEARKKAEAEENEMFLRALGKRLCVRAEKTSPSFNNDAGSQPIRMEGKSFTLHFDAENGKSRIYGVEGGGSVYMLNVERIKALRGDVLHLDVEPEDAKYVIGIKGSNIRETVTELNKRGCHLRTIKVHTK